MHSIFARTDLTRTLDVPETRGLVPRSDWSMLEKSPTPERYLLPKAVHSANVIEQTDCEP